MLPVSPITEETLMILPVPRTSMCSSAAWATKKAPARLMETTRSQSSSPILATVLSMVIPALLTRMSRRPCCSMTSRTTRRQSSGSPMFPLWTVIVPGYSAFMSSVNFSAASCCRQYPAATCAPSWARRWLMAAPMPRVPPVTRATRPSSRPNASGGFASVAVVMVLLLSVSLAVAAMWRTLGVQWFWGWGGICRSRLREFVLQDLAEGVLRQLGAELEDPRALVGGQPLPAPGDQLVLAQFHRPAHDDHGHDFLAEPLVGHADDGGLGHGRVGVQHVLDLARVHVVPAADDELLLPADDEQEPVLVEVAEVAGVQPGAGEGLGGRLRPVQVPLHHVHAAGDDLAHVLGAGRQRTALVVPDLGLRPPDRLADAVGAALGRAGVERGRGRGLGHPVALQDDQAEAPLERIEDGGWNRRPAGDGDPQRGQVVAVQVRA